MCAYNDRRRDHFAKVAPQRYPAPLAKLRTLQSNLAGQLGAPPLNETNYPKPHGKPNTDITADLDRMQQDLEAMAKGRP